MVESGKNKKLSPVKRVAGFVVILLAGIGGFVIGGSAVGLFSGSPSDEIAAEGFNGVAHVVAMFIFGCFGLAFGAEGYLVVLLTQCFTFDFKKPFFPASKKKLYAANIFVSAPFAIGVACFTSMVLTPMLIYAGLGQMLSYLLPLLVPFLVVQLSMAWLNVWTPLDKSMISRRLQMLGVSKDQIDAGCTVGVSDPSRSSLKKLTMVEDDVGILWIGPDQLVYRGDSQNFTLHRDQLIAIERTTDAGSMVAYAGGANPVLRYRQSDGGECAVRLHMEGAWTLGASAKSLDALSDRLDAWHNGGEPGQLPESR